MRSPSLAFVVPMVMVALAGCEDKGKISEQQAVDAAVKLVPVVKDAAEQVRRGLPLGAKKLGTLVDADPGANLVGLQKNIQISRSSVPDLDRAKSTFFSFADPSGVVLRSEVDPDLLAGKSVFAAFPPLKKATEASSGVVEVYGEMQEMRGVKNGPDLQWVLAHPVAAPDGAVKGVFVTGWSFRVFANYLEGTVNRVLFESSQEDSKKKKTVPLVYVFAIKGTKAYGGPVTPDVNAEAVEKLDLIGKTGAGPYRGTIDITGRTFGVAAHRTPELGDDAAVAVILSVL
jgi:hypothetical protein